MANGRLKTRVLLFLKEYPGIGTELSSFYKPHNDPPDRIVSDLKSFLIREGEMILKTDFP